MRNLTKEQRESECMILGRALQWKLVRYSEEAEGGGGFFCKLER